MKTLPMLLAATLLSAPFAVLAQNAPQGVVVTEKTSDGGAIAGEVQFQGKIKSIDKKERSVVIVGSSGNEMSLTLGDKAKNFDQIKVGDLVTLTVQRALSMELRKVGKDATRSRVEAENVIAAKPGEKPGVAVEKTIVAVADVTAVNEKAQTVTLRGAKGTMDLAVKDPAIMKKVKVGDQVEATYIEAISLIVSADPTAKK